MKRFLTEHRINLNVFATVLFVFTMLFTFDRFSFETVTTETPLIKIGELPMLRMDFVSLLFSLTALIGAAIGSILSYKGKKFSSLASTGLGIITMVFIFFDVDMLQILVPDMRISHVIMTLSRLSAIVLGASGLIVGLALSFVDLSKHKLSAAYGVTVSVFISVLAVSDMMYVFAYTIVAAILLIVGIAGQFFKEELIINEPNAKKCGIKTLIFDSADNILRAIPLVIIALTSYGYLVTNLEYSVSSVILAVGVTFIAYTIAGRRTIKNRNEYILYGIIALIAFALIVTSIFVSSLTIILLADAMFGFASGITNKKSTETRTSPLSFVITCIAVFIGAIISYVVIHDMSEVMNFSGNRVVYLVQSNLYIIITVLFAVRVALFALRPVIIKENYDNTQA